MKRALAVALLLAAAVATDALACSCAGRDARSALAASKTAFTGVVESRREERPSTGPQSSTDPAIYVVRVERELKGDLPERVELVTATGGASCGLENEVGDRIGLALDDEPGARMRASLCETADPDELIEAAGPFPAPQDGTGVRYLVPLPLGDAGLAAYDAAGRLRAYGFGVKGTALAACPGGTTALAAGDALQVIRLRDLRVTSTTSLPGDDTAAVRCLSADGATAAAVTFAYGPASERKRLVRIDRGRVRTLHRARTDAVAITRRVAVVVESRRPRWTAVAIGLRDGRARRLAGGTGGTWAIAARADGARVALAHGLDEHSFDRMGITVLDPARAGRLAFRRVGLTADGGRMAYFGNRLAIAGHRRGVVLDRSLRRVGTVPAIDGGYVGAAAGKFVLASDQIGLGLVVPGAKRPRRLTELPVSPRGAPLALAAPVTLEGHRTDAARADGTAEASSSSSSSRKRCATWFDLALRTLAELTSRRAGRTPS